MEEQGFASVDPGLRHCGVAYFAPGGVLATAFLVHNPVKNERGASAWVAMAWAVAEALAPYPYVGGVVEKPKLYSGEQSESDPDDLIELTAVAGAISLVLSVRGGTVQSPLAREWKGQIPKQVMVRRIASRLTPAETQRIQQPAPSLVHNVMDGIGLGLWRLGRLR